MAVANAIAMDARVRKTATSVRRLGYRVTLLWADETGKGVTEGDLDGVRTIGLPVPYLLRRRAVARDARRVRPRSGWLNPGYRDHADRQTHAAALAARQARLDSDVVPLALRWARSVHWLRSKLLAAAIVCRRRWYGRWRQRRPWQKELAEVADLDGIFVPWMVDLKPDVLHLHDIHLLSAGIHAKRRLGRRGEAPKLIYDAHEYVRGMAGPDSYRDVAFTALEKDLVKEADAVITVSQPIAESLVRDLGLTAEPVVVMNTPWRDSGWGGAGDGAAPDVRTAVGLASDVPLAVYCGVLHLNRNLKRLVEAVALVDGLHLALVCVPNAHYPVALALAERAKALGIGPRVHLVEPVPPNEVVPFLAGASLGVHPMALGLPNHEMALPNKLFDYVWAGLPVAVSRVKAMAEFVAEAGIGHTFDPEDPASIASAIQRVLDNREQLAAAAAAPELKDRLAWEAQAGRLANLYAQLAPLGRPPEGQP
jgi:glycosyltransferase involved in cell wall biosynthesis